MTNNKSNQAKNKSNLLGIKKEECCSQCGNEGVDPKYSKYVLPKLFYTIDVFICDLCQTIWVVHDTSDDQYYRQELSRDILKEQNVLPF